MTDEDAPDSDDLHRVAPVSAFDDTDRVIVDIEGREIAVFRVDDEFFALLNYCVHQGGPLCEGSRSGTLVADENFKLAYGREGEVLSCPWHGWEFDIRTGDHLAQTGYTTPTFEVVRRDGAVYIRA